MKGVSAQDIVVSRPDVLPKPRRVTTITFDDPGANPGAQSPSFTKDIHQEQKPTRSGIGAASPAVEAGPGSPHPDDKAEKTEVRGESAHQDTIWQPASTLTRVITDDPDAIKPIERTRSGGRSRYRSSHTEGPVLQAAKSIEKVASSAFVLGDARPPRPRSRSRSRSTLRQQSLDLPALSRQVTVGRNSNFYNMSEMDRERLGGIEYRALKLLLKFVFGMEPLKSCPQPAQQLIMLQRVFLRPSPARGHLPLALDS